MMMIMIMMKKKKMMTTTTRIFINLMVARDNCGIKSR